MQRFFDDIQMKSILVILVFFSAQAHAGIFGASNYQECVDDVVKNAKFKEALYEGQSNCYEKFIRPIQDRMQSKGWSSAYRSATPAEKKQLRCSKNGLFQGNYFIKCRFSELPMSKYSKIKISFLLKNGKNKALEFNNYAPNSTWDNDALTSYDEVEVEKIDINSLQVSDVN